MRSPMDSNTVQIEITNACFNRCANCTRFCGHHAKPFFMDFETFKKAVDSVVGFPHMVGIMGGEPTLHPDFERMMSYFREKIPAKVEYHGLTQPVDWFANDNTGGRGLWSALGNKYYEHFELIQDVFPFQTINDHSSEGCWHQTLLVTRKELGIHDEEWIKLRDNCWIQNCWSAAITPKGAFFCEVAAALDTLFDGSGGWPIEPGWWRRQPNDFTDQLHWCELCSAALTVPKALSKDEIDLVSPALYEKLKQVGSPKLKNGLVKVLDLTQSLAEQSKRSDYTAIEYMDLNFSEERVGKDNKSIRPREIKVFYTHPFNAPVPECFDGVLTEAELNRLEFSDWAMIINPALRIHPSFIKRLRVLIFNPGCLYFYLPKGGPLESPENILASSPFILINRNAIALRGKDHINIDAGFIADWPLEKNVLLNSYSYTGRIPIRRLLRVAWNELSKDPFNFLVYCGIMLRRKISGHR